jgi:hypothetical protein
MIKSIVFTAFPHLFRGASRVFERTHRFLKA